MRTEHQEVDRASVASQFAGRLAVLGVAVNPAQLGDPLERARHFVVDRVLDAPGAGHRVEGGELARLVGGERLRDVESTGASWRAVIGDADPTQ